MGTSKTVYFFKETNFWLLIFYLIFCVDQFLWFIYIFDSFSFLFDDHVLLIHHPKLKMLLIPKDNPKFSFKSYQVIKKFYLTPKM